MPQCHLASHAIAVGVDMRRKHDPAAGREHRGDLGGRARALGGNRDSVRAHGIKINKSLKQRRHARASRKKVTQERRTKTSRERVTSTVRGCRRATGAGLLVSQGIGAVALSPPQAAAASTTQHDQTFMAPPAGRSPNAAHSSQTYGMVTQNDRTAGWADGSA